MSHKIAPKDIKESSNGFATIQTSLQPGTVAVVKIGEKAIKVAIK